MEVLQNILVRNVICGLLFLLMIVVHLTEVISEPYKKFATIGLLILFALVIPLRAGFATFTTGLVWAVRNRSSRGV